MSGSQRLKMNQIQHFPPQVQVKLLFVPKALGISAALFMSRRKKLLEAPLPEKLSEVVKELTVPRKPLPPEPAGNAKMQKSPRLDSPPRGARSGSVLMAGGAKEALVAMSLAATQLSQVKKEEEGAEEEEQAGQNYMAIDHSAMLGGNATPSPLQPQPAFKTPVAEKADEEEDDEEGGSDMYKAVNHEELQAAPPAAPKPVAKPPAAKRPIPAIARLQDDEPEASGNGYKSIDNTLLEEEMEQVLQERMPNKVRGRTSSVMTRVVREKDEWRDMDSFNARFQEAVETMNMHGAQSNTRRKELIESCLTVIRLAQDFATLASQYGKTIISEHALPESKKTIKPRKDLGGVLGGEKFIVLGILFKFATDEKNLFKSLSDPLEAANKIAGLEL